MGCASCADLTQIIAAVGSWADADCPGCFDQLVLSSAIQLVPSDSALLTVCGHGWRTTRTEPPTFLPYADQLIFEKIHRAEPHPLWCSARDGFGNEPQRLSDVLTRGQYQSSRMYIELFRKLEIEYQVAFSVPVAPGGVLCLVLNRKQGDFSNRDVECLRQLRVVLGGWATRVHGRWAARMNGDGPAPVDAFAHLDGRAGTAALTEREGQVLGLIAHGLTNAQVARTLATSARTIDKHLEHLYRKLGVTSRTEAVAAWAGLELPGALSPR
jgi:DNA-binding CsgD family transcriptional regulator